ncbi:MAG: O-antigen ligase family protein [Chloroflexi bacterium]|nr:O-antigen ligase family protein [Chloroflexota bacterium]
MSRLPFNYYWLEGILLSVATLPLIFPEPIPPLTAVSLLLLALISSLPLLTHHRPILPSTPLNLLVLLWLVGLGVSFLITADPDKTLPQVTRFIASLVIFYTLVFSLRQRRHLTWFAYGLMGLAALFALVAPFAVQWNLAKGIPIPNAIYDLFPLLVADAIHPNIMASLMVLLLPLPLAYVLLHWPRRGVAWWLCLAAAVLPGFILLLTKSRAGYLAAVSGVLIVLWLAHRRALALALLGAAAVAILWLLNTTDPTLPTTASSLTNPGTMQFRLEVWRVALDMLADFPFTGVGIGAFNNVAMRLYPLAENNNPGAHNIFLQVGVDLGFPGLIVYMALLILLVYLAWTSLQTARQSQDTTLQAMLIGALAGIVAYSAHGLLDNGLWSTQVSFVPWLMFALVTAVHRLKQ